MQIEINDEEIDVKDIISKMKTELGKHQFKENLQDISIDYADITSGSSLDIKSLHERVDIVNRSWNNNPEFLITSHRKYIGPFIVWGKKLARKLSRWYITPYATAQNEFNGNVTRTINEMFTQFNVTNEMLKKKDDLLNTLQSQYNKVTMNYSKLEEFIQHEQIEINAKITEIDESVQEVKATVNAKFELSEHNVVTFSERIDIELSQIKNGLSQIKNELEQMESGAEITTLKINTRVGNERLRRIERKLKYFERENSDENILTPDSSESVILKETKGLDFDYFLFEEYFRGSREEIIRRQRQYLPYFTNAELVLDLGCGRGEFTELLLQEKVNVVSVDLDDDMVEYCRDRGFNIKKMDLLQYLKTVEDNSVDGIFLGQVIEHMQAEDLINMVKLAYKKLKPNCWLIAETPNPQSLSIFAQSFYLDLTHNKPVHPFTSKFIWETEGFRDVEIQYFSPNNSIVQLPPLTIPTMDQEIMSKFNTGLGYWNDIIFGNQDYFVAGKK